MCSPLCFRLTVCTPSSEGVNLMSYKESGKSAISHSSVLPVGLASWASISRGSVPTDNRGNWHRCEWNRCQQYDWRCIVQSFSLADLSFSKHGIQNATVKPGDLRYSPGILSWNSHLVPGPVDPIPAMSLTTVSRTRPDGSPPTFSMKGLPTKCQTPGVFVDLVAHLSSECNYTIQYISAHCIQSSSLKGVRYAICQARKCLCLPTSNMSGLRTGCCRGIFRAHGAWTAAGSVWDHLPHT